MGSPPFNIHVAWTTSVTLWKASSSVRRGQWSILIHKVQVGYMQNSLAQGRHSVNALVSLAPSPLEDSAHSFHVISFQSDQLQSKLKFGVIFDAAGIRQGFCPWSDSLEVESHFSLHSGPCSEEEMHGQAAAMISASQEKLALQSHLLFGEPLKRASDGNASSRNRPYTNWHNTLHLHNSFFLQGSVDIDTWPFIHCILLPWVRWLPTLVGGREALALRPPSAQDLYVVFE